MHLNSHVNSMIISQGAKAENSLETTSFVTNMEKNGRIPSQNQ